MECSINRAITKIESNVRAGTVWLGALNVNVPNEEIQKTSKTANMKRKVMGETFGGAENFYWSHLKVMMTPFVKKYNNGYISAKVN